MGIRDVRVFTVDIAGWAIFTHQEFRGLHEIHKSDQQIKVGGRIRTPYD